MDIIASYKQLRLFVEEHQTNLPQARLMLMEALKKVLDSDFNRIWNILYRIDLDEKKVMEAFDEEEPDAIVGKLADLILERQLQKIESRNKYSGS